MAHILVLNFLISSGSKEKDTRCECVSEAKGFTLTQNVNSGFFFSTTFLPQLGCHLFFDVEYIYDFV